jgi:tetratricopeptide (TPR) repeat protein
MAATTKLAAQAKDDRELQRVPTSEMLAIELSALRAAGVPCHEMADLKRAHEERINSLARDLKEWFGGLSPADSREKGVFEVLSVISNEDVSFKRGSMLSTTLLSEKREHNCYTSVEESAAVLERAFPEIRISAILVSRERSGRPRSHILLAGETLAFETMGVGPSSVFPRSELSEHFSHWVEAPIRDGLLHAAHRHAGGTFQERGMYEKAMASYDKAIELVPGETGALLNKAITLYATRHFEESLDMYDKIIGIAEDLSYAWINKGKVLCMLKRPEDALVAFDEAISLKQEDANAWVCKGSVLSHLGRCQGAIEAFEIAQGLDPKNEVAMLGKVLALAKMTEAVRSDEDNAASGIRILHRKD